MTATLQEIQQDPLRLIDMARQGHAIEITSDGKIVARITGVIEASPSRNRAGWLAKLAALRRRLETGRNGLSIEQILEEDRGR